LGGGKVVKRETHEPHSGGHAMSTNVCIPKEKKRKVEAKVWSIKHVANSGNSKKKLTERYRRNRTSSLHAYKVVYLLTNPSNTNS
jgi:hypothetical protein